MIYGIRSFIRGISGQSYGGGKEAVSHLALYDTETGLFRLQHAFPEWDEPSKEGSLAMNISDFEPRGITTDWQFELEKMPEAIDAYLALVAVDRFTIHEDLPSDLDPAQVIFVDGFKNTGKGADILITALVNPSHISVLALCLFAKSIQDSCDFSDALGVCAGDDDEDEDEDGNTGLLVQSLSYGFGGFLH